MDRSNKIRDVILDGDIVKTETYKTRWYILILFSLFTMESCAIWNTWGPLSSTAIKVYGWTESTIALYTLWGCLDFPIFFLPSAWLLGRSLRWSIVVGTSCMLVGAAVRCLPLLFSLDDEDRVFTILCHTGAFINAMAGPIAMSAPIQISSAWFPPLERSLATSVGQMFNALGVGVSFILGTFMVQDYQEACGGQEEAELASCLALRRGEMNALLVLHAVTAAVISLLIYIYFPSAPPLPPTASAVQPRTLFLQGFKILVKSPAAWCVMVTYAMSQGLVQMWQSVMVINLTALDLPGVTEKWASSLGIVVSFVAVFASILFATFLKWFKTRMKIVIIFLLLGAGTMFILATLLFQNVLFPSGGESFKISTYVFILIGISFSCASAPILFEFSVELCYPVAEGCIGTWLTLWFNIVSILFFLIFQIPDIGTGWLNYVLPISVLAPLPLLCLVEESYNRLTVDENQVKKSVD